MFSSANKAVLATSVGLIVSSLASTPLTLAQDREAMILEEVVVTARRRAESMQETPIAVSAFTGAKLAEAGINNLSDFGLVVPNMDVVNGNGTSGKGSIFIRGVGQRNTGIQIDSGVGIYLNDQYISRADGALLDINDIASVQVLRGPQGTLFGKNTTGGAVVFTTNKPSDEYEGKIKLRVGNYDRADGDFMLNVPLSDTVFTRFSGTLVKRDGYMKNIVDGRKWTDEDRISGIAQLRWLASEDITLDLNYNYGDTDQMSRGQKCLLDPDVIGWQDTLRDQLFTLTFGMTGRELCAESQNLPSDEFTSDMVARYEAETHGASATLEWEVSDSLSFKSVTGWRRTESSDDSDLDSIRAPLLGATDSQHPFARGREADQFSQEFQLLGEAFEDKVNWVAGVYYFSEESESRRVNLLGPWLASDLGASHIITHTSSSTGKEAENSAWAAYAQMDWAITDNWELTLGLRYTDEERKFTNDVYATYRPETITTGSTVVPIAQDTWLIDADTYNPNYSFVAPDSLSLSVSDSDVSPTLSLKYLFEGGDVIDGGSAYLTLSRGFLSGGISESDKAALETFDAEEVENFEIGVKIDAMDRRLRVNAALFYTDYTNRQLTSLVVNPNTNSPASVTINAPESTIAGLELETTFLATDNLQLTFNATWNNGDIDEFDDALIRNFTGDPNCIPALDGAVEQCPVDRSSEELPRLADSSYYVSAQYYWQTSIGVIIPRVSWSLKNDVEHCFDYTSCRSGLWNSDKEEDVSARITWQSNDEKWMAVLYGTNLGDEDFANGGVPLDDSFGWGGQTTTPPRMYGLELHSEW